MSKLSRAKGHSFERWVANQFKKIFPDARRHLEYQMQEANGVDVVGVHPYLVQCKRGRKYSSITAIREIEICPIYGGIPVLITKGDRTEPMAILPFSDFLRLVHAAKTSGME